MKPSFTLVTLKVAYKFKNTFNCTKTLKQNNSFANSLVTLSCSYDYNNYDH